MRAKRPDVMGDPGWDVGVERPWPDEARGIAETLRTGVVGKSETEWACA